MKKYLYCILFFAFACIATVHAQDDDAMLKHRLQGKQNLTEIMNEVKAYYKEPATISKFGKESINRNLKQWARYEWYMSRHLGPNGEFVNINEKVIEATGLQQNRKLSTTANFGEGSQITSGNWQLIGPTETPQGIGRVDRLAFHPTDANTVYAGASGGGLWRTTDAGNNWTNLTPDIPCLGIGGIAINYNSPNTIYILTGDGDSGTGGLVGGHGYNRLSIGVLKSTDGGTTWVKTGIFPGADYSALAGLRLTMHPTDPNILFACTTQGLYRTADGCNTWTLVDNRGKFFNLKFKPGSTDICYAVSRDTSFSRFFKSTDGGLSFISHTYINNLLGGGASRLDLAVAPSNSSIVYVLSGGVPDSGYFRGLYRSQNSADSFTLQSDTPNILGRSEIGDDKESQANYDLTIAVSNTNSQTVALGGIKVWRSIDNGVNWVYRHTLHDDVHELGYHPVGNKLWAATDGGVYSSVDNGVNWADHTTGMSVSTFYKMSVSPDNYQDMIGGLQDNGAKKRTGVTSTFSKLNGGDGFTTAYDQVDPSIYYAIMNTDIVRWDNHGINRRSVRWELMSLPYDASMAASTSQVGTLYVGESAFWRNSTAYDSATWIVIPTVQGGWAMRTCPSNGNRIYMAGGDNYSSSTGILRRSDNAGSTWPNEIILSDKPGFPLIYPRITSINVNPTDSRKVWITFGGFTDTSKVYSSTDAGLTWANRTRTLPNLPVNTIAIDNGNNAYIGTDNGVYYLASGSSDWVPFYNDLPYVPVTDLVISESANVIRASTFGRGIWSSNLYSECAANLIVVGTIEGQKFFEASNNISSTATLLASEGTKIQMRGANQVLFTDGFTAKENSGLRALIGPCGSGGVAGFLVANNDSTDLLPAKQYLPPSDGKKALIHIESIDKTLAKFLVTQRFDGMAELIVTNEEGKIIQRKKFSSSAKGKWKNHFDVSGLNAGLYYVRLLIDKRAEHLQELIIK